MKSISVSAIVVLFLSLVNSKADIFYVANGGDGTIKKIDETGQITTFASGFSDPQGVALDSFGNLFVASGGDRTIKKITPQGQVTTFITFGISSVGLAFDQSGNLYAAQYPGVVVRITPGGVASDFATALNAPYGLAFDSLGNLYAANLGDDTISKITPSGSVSTFASGLSGPVSLAFDRQNNLYAVNNISASISKISPGGNISLFASGFVFPGGDVVDSHGDLYVADIFKGTLSRITPGGAVSTFVTGLSQPHFLAVQAVPSIRCAAPLVLECKNGEAVGTLEVDVIRSVNNPLVVIWAVDGTPYQTNNIPSGGVLTSTNLAFTSDFGPGEHLVTVSANNGETNSASCSTVVQVRDTIPPQILGVSARPNVLWPPDHQMVAVTIEVQATDSCGPTTSKIVGVTSNEPSGSSSGNKGGPDWLITGDLSLLLRAERLGNGVGRAYTILVECDDLAGNPSVGSVMVTVPHDEGAGSSLR